MDRGGSEHEAIDELTSLADELLEQASEVRRQWAELSETLGVEPPEPAPAAGRKAQKPAPQEGSPAVQPDDADPVRLVALDMMLSGRSREEVRDYLRATFGEGDRDDVLDEIFTQYSG